MVVKKFWGLDLLQFDEFSFGLLVFNVLGIDNVFDVLSLVGLVMQDKIDRYFERRFKVVYVVFEQRRLVEMELDGMGQGLRLNQKKEKIKKEFEKSLENLFNQVSVRYDVIKEELVELKVEERRKIEVRLGKQSVGVED